MVCLLYNAVNDHLGRETDCYLGPITVYSPSVMWTFHQGGWIHIQNIDSKLALRPFFISYMSVSVANQDLVGTYVA